MPPNNQLLVPQKVVVGTSIYSSRPSMTPDLITFQYEGSCVFVTPAQSYQDAINLARKEFDGLCDIPSSRIALSLEDNSNGRRQIRISEGAWTAVASKLPRGAIITIVIRPEVDIKPPPQYLEVPERNHSVPRSRSHNDIRRIPSNSSSHSSKSTKSASSKARFSFLGF
ncbi:hypothetical protein GALMADRAFT_140348 [Galerina marginata CBS 339.88]|uniref:Uncharacterized protein n=1 Tax=Galerina marginata (strain CBS 339.88) TaxID=685588 RepID=A0A067T081_GALM3|nr:hypothetical protein GALMADRAFT_140348 [Galerina marginata CBS 339.88]